MKATYEFTLPEEQEELEIFQKAMENHIALERIGEMLRKADKYGEYKQTESRQLIEDLRDEYYEILE